MSVLRTLSMTNASQISRVEYNRRKGPKETIIIEKNTRARSINRHIIDLHVKLI